MDKTFVCRECHKETKHYGKNMCQKCYMRLYRQDPEYKKRRALHEKESRLNGKRDATEKKRSNTEKRKEWVLKYRQSYYKKNRKKLIAYQKEYRRKNREKVQKADATRKKNLRSSAKNFSERDWHNVLEFYEWKCFYCHVDLDNPERDHKLPVTRGGETTVDNIVPTCHSCNCKKNNRTVDEYREFLLLIGETPVF